MPASASASSSSASRASSLCCSVMLTISVSGSTSSVEPSGSSSWPARIWVPAGSPSIEISMFSGMLVASASICTVVFSVTTRVSEAASPTRWTRTSTVTFSPRRTATKSMCSMVRRIGSICTCLVSASWLVPSMSSSSSALAPPCLSAIIVSWPGRVTCTGLVAVAVEDRGDLVVATDPARGALAELGAGLGGDLLGGHAGGCSSGQWSAWSRASTRSRRHTARRHAGAPALSITESGVRSPSPRQPQQSSDGGAPPANPSRSVGWPRCPP